MEHLTHVMLWLATIGLVVPQVGIASAADPVPKADQDQVARQVTIVDVALTQDNLLRGQVVNGEGTPKAKAKVTLASSGRVVAQTVTDDQGVAVSCPLTSLDPGDSMTCTAAGIAEDLNATTFTTVPGLCGGFPQTPLYENMGQVVGTATTGEFLQDVDPSHYCIPQEPNIDIEKATNGVDADDPNAGDAPQIKAMSRNLYLGADLLPVVSAPDIPTLMERAATVAKTVHATDFPTRAKALAAEIQAEEPWLIGLQEVSLWRRGATGVLDGPVTPAPA